VTHPHERLLRDEYEARARRDDVALEDLLADDVVWHVPGRSAIAGTYRGKAEVMSYVQRRRSLTDGTFDITVDDVLANDRHGLVIATGRAVRESRVAEWRAHGLYRFEGGKIAECRVLPEDQEAFDEIWR
jgi:ketosteroid isomerase-like protein